MGIRFGRNRIPCEILHGAIVEPAQASPEGAPGKAVQAPMITR